MQLIFLQICLIICFFKYFFLLHYFSFRFSHVSKEVYRAICYIFSALVSFYFYYKILLVYNNCYFSIYLQNIKI